MRHERLFGLRRPPIPGVVLQAYGHTDKGSVRASNEDCFAVDERLQLCVVADGMGGHNAGEVAARLAVRNLLESVRAHISPPSSPEPGAAGPAPEWPFGFDPLLSHAGNCLRTAIHVANEHILEASMADEECAGMGTTVVAAIMQGGRLSVAHAGDSRLYVLGATGLRPLTRDDSWTAAVAARDGTIDPAVARNHPMRNALTNVVGTRPSPDVHVTEETLAGGDLLLLSTDGVHGALDDCWLARLLAGTDDLRAMAVGLVDAAIASGSRDNCTAVVARYLPD